MCFLALGIPVKTSVPDFLVAGPGNRVSADGAAFLYLRVFAL
jgi:hypothetical protein